MVLWKPWTWTKLDIIDIWEYGSSLFAAGCSVWTATADSDKKTLPATLVCLATVSSLTAKLVSKRVEKVTKEAKEKKAGSVVRGVVHAILEQMRDEYFAKEVG